MIVFTHFIIFFDHHHHEIIYNYQNPEYSPYFSFMLAFFKELSHGMKNKTFYYLKRSLSWILTSRTLFQNSALVAHTCTGSKKQYDNDDITTKPTNIRNCNVARI